MLARSRMVTLPCVTFSCSLTSRHVCVCVFVFVFVFVCMLCVLGLFRQEFGRFVKFAKDQQEALQATDSDGRSLVHIAVAIKEMQADR